MRQSANATATMPADVRLALLRDAVAVLDPRRNPGTRAEAAAVLCEALVAEGARRNNRRLITEALLVAADTITEGPLPAIPRSALLDAMRDAAGLLADGYEEGALAASRHHKQRRRPAALRAAP